MIPRTAAVAAALLTLSACGGGAEREAGGPGASPTPEHSVGFTGEPGRSVDPGARGGRTVTPPTGATAPPGATLIPNPGATLVHGREADEADREAQGSADLAMMAAKRIYAETEDARQITPERLKRTQPSLDYVDDGPSRGPRLIGVKAVSQPDVRVAAWSQSGVCWGIRFNAAGSGTTHASRYVGEQKEVTCRATLFGDAEWAPAW